MQRPPQSTDWEKPPTSTRYAASHEPWANGAALLTAATNQLATTISAARATNAGTSLTPGPPLATVLPDPTLPLFCPGILEKYHQQNA